MTTRSRILFETFVCFISRFSWGKWKTKVNEETSKLHDEDFYTGFEIFCAICILSRSQIMRPSVVLSPLSMIPRRRNSQRKPCTLPLLMRLSSPDTHTSCNHRLQKTGICVHGQKNKNHVNFSSLPAPTSNLPPAKTFHSNRVQE